MSFPRYKGSTYDWAFIFSPIAQRLCFFTVWQTSLPPILIYSKDYYLYVYFFKN